MGTLKKEVFLSGVGIHSGLPVNITVRPYSETGIFFQRTDIANSEIIPATYDNVGDTKMRNTTVGKLSGAHVQTIEHLMAALLLAGIDSAIVEIDGAETPILDGSAAEFYQAFINVGINASPIKKIRVKKEITARASEIIRQLPIFVRLQIFVMNLIAGRKNDGFVKLSPNQGTGLDISAVLVYKEAVIGTQSYRYMFDESKASVQDFVENIARARTFGKFGEWEYLKARGMARGASEHNVIALNDAGDKTLNPVIWPDEFVRHKIIDALGDMFTSTGLVLGNLESFKGSHALNNLVLKKLFSNSDNYDIITVNE